MPDPTDLDSPLPNDYAPDGVVTAEEVWNEIGQPVDHPNSHSYTPIEAIQATINRVLRGYQDQVISQLSQAEDEGRFGQYQEPHTLTLSPHAPNPNLAEASIPDRYLPYLFEDVVAPDGTPLGADEDIEETAYTALPWDDFRYKLQGQLLLVLPDDIDEVTAYLVPRRKAIEEGLRGVVPDINQEIIEAARAALETRTEEAGRIEQEALRETPPA